MCEHGGLAELDMEGLLDVAEAALRRIATLSLGGAVADTALTRCVQRLEAVARMAQARKLDVVAEIAQRHAHRGQAAATTSDLLARELRLTPGEAKAQVELAEGLALVPDTAKALADGRIGLGQAAVTVRKAEEVKDRADARELLATIDATASTAGQHLDRNRLARHIDTAVAGEDTDVLADRERAAHRRRRLDITTRDGMTIVHAELDAYAGAHVRAALDALSRKDGDADTRTLPQRQADALTALATRALQTRGELAALGGTAREVVLITTPDALHARPGAAPALLDGHGPVSTELARQICCDARVTAVRTDRTGKVLNVGRTSRTASDAQRAAVIARDKACVGCGAPISRCQIHHITWWRDGGHTNLDNLVLVCWNCHTDIHHHQWQITRDATGCYHAGPPQDEAPPQDLMPPQDPEPPHLDKSIAQPGLALAHSG